MREALCLHTQDQSLPLLLLKLHFFFAYETVIPVKKKMKTYCSNISKELFCILPQADNLKRSKMAGQQALYS